MRFIYDKTTKIISGVIAERVTSHIPPSYVGKNSTYIDIDYNQKSLIINKLARLLEKQGSNLVGKIILIDGDKISFEGGPEKQYMKTVVIDLDNPVLHKDVAIYSKKGRERGAKVEIEDIDSKILVKILDGKEIVGIIRLQKRGCCTYVYQQGEVYDRNFYPHYVGFESLVKYLKGKVKWLDMGGLLKKDDDLNRFKKKWGKPTLVEVN